MSSDSDRLVGLTKYFNFDSSLISFVLLLIGLGKIQTMCKTNFEDGLQTQFLIISCSLTYFVVLQMQDSSGDILHLITSQKESLIYWYR